MNMKIPENKMSIIPEKFDYSNNESYTEEVMREQLNELKDRLVDIIFHERDLSHKKEVLLVRIEELQKKYDTWLSIAYPNLEL